VSASTTATRATSGGGWSFDADKGWTLDPAMKEQNDAELRAALAAIDTSHAHLPTCALCGQRCLKRDRYGLCSKVTEAHKAWRASTRAEEKASSR